jgi:hypothetical protein
MNGRDFQLKLTEGLSTKNTFQKYKSKVLLRDGTRYCPILRVNQYWSNDKLNLTVLSTAPGPVLSSNWHAILQSFM